MLAEMKGIDEVRRARRAAMRAVQLMDANALGEQEVDLCRLLFGEPSIDEKLMPFGFLDDGGICDDVVEQISIEVVLKFEFYSIVSKLADRISGQLLELQRQRSEKAERGEVDLPPGLSRKVPAPGREDVAERNARTSRNANARLLAVHLAQRAIYEGMSRGFAELVRRQSKGLYGKGRSNEAEYARDAEEAAMFNLGHGSLAMSDKHVAAADIAISRMRKPHFARWSRNLGDFVFAPEPHLAIPAPDDLSASL